MCNTRILAQNKSVLICHCTECKVVYVWNVNLLLSLMPEDFNSFKKMLDKLDFEDCAFPFPDNNVRIIIKTPNPDISFTFTEDEWDEFNEAINEATYMQEVYALMQ